MSAQNIFGIVIRSSGFLLILFASVMFLNMLFGGADLTFMRFLHFAANVALGGAVIKLAPVFMEFGYGSDGSSS